jgi:hypothetical protein
MAEQKFVDLVTSAYAYLTARQDHLKETFGLSNYERWDWDDDRGAVVFSDAGVPRVVAPSQLVGSVSRKTGTWLWAWANEHVEPRLCRDLEEVRRYGEHHGIWQLTTPKWEADETDGWEMTSIAAYILQAKGGYRMPNDQVFSFAIFEAVEWVPGAAV